MAEEKRLCPLMSVASLMPQAANLVQGVGMGAAPSKGPHATRCAGPECMWWVPVADGATGRVTSGQCSLALIPTGLEMIGRLVAGSIQHAAGGGQNGKAQTNS